MKTLFNIFVPFLFLTFANGQLYKVGGSSKYGGNFKVVSTQQYEIFEVSKVGKDKIKLMELFESIERWENESRVYGQITLDKKEEDGTKVDVDRNKTNDVKPYRWRVLKRLDESNYIVSDESSGECKLELLVPKDLADEEYIVALSRRTDKTFSYKEKNIRIYVETNEPFERIEIPKFTKEEFIQRLKNGECWSLRKPVACRRCFGDGKLTALDKYKDCPDCKAVGMVDYIVYVVWSSREFKVIGVE